MEISVSKNPLYKKYIEIDNNPQKQDELRQRNPSNDLRVNNQELCDHLFNLHSNFTIDILFLFHSFDLKYYADLIEYFRKKIATKNLQKTRIAIGYYYQRRFEINQFKDSKNFKTKILNDVIDVKADILNLDWDRKSYKLVVNIIKESIRVFDNVVNYFLPDKNVDSILSSEDTVGKQLKYENIGFRKVYIKESHIDQQVIDEILSDKFLLARTSEQTQEAYLKELYFLKRNLFLTFNEYQTSRREKVFSEKYKSFPVNYKIPLTFEVYEKENVSSNIKLESSKKREFKFKGDITEPTRNLFLTLAKYYKSTHEGYVWVEIFDNDAMLNRILDIHLTAECLVEHFKKLKSSLKLDIARVNRLVYNSMSIISICAYKELVKSEIKTPREHKFQAIECFTHFTYEKTKGNLIVIDLRTLTFENEYLITEPVVFSVVSDRFNSSNLGLRGIENFKKKHKCNNFCKEIELRSLN